MNTRKTGAEYEAMAARYLKEQGYQILERNYKNRFGEIDILAKKDPELVVVEVKYRSTSCHGDPLEAVDARKQRKICHTASYYYMMHGIAENVPCRFDVIAIYGDGTLRHEKNAFEFQT